MRNIASVEAEAVEFERASAMIQAAPFDWPERRFIRALFAFRNACDDLVANLNENDVPSIVWASRMMKLACQIATNASDQLAATMNKPSLLACVNGMCKDVTVRKDDDDEEDDDNDNDDDDDHDDDHDDDDDEYAGGDSLKAVIRGRDEGLAAQDLAREVRFLHVLSKSIEIKSDVCDTVHLRVFEIGGAQFASFSCLNQSCWLLRQAWLAVGPAGLPVFVDSSGAPYSYSYDNDNNPISNVIAPYVFQVLSATHRPAPSRWPLTLARWGKQLPYGSNRTPLTEIKLASADLAPVRELIDLPHITQQLSDNSLRLVLAVAQGSGVDSAPLIRSIKRVRHREPTAEQFAQIGRVVPSDQQTEKQLRELVDFFHPFEDMVDYVMALAPLGLPSLVLLAILDCLPDWVRTSRFAKCKMIEGVLKSITKVVNNRNSDGAATTTAGGMKKRSRAAEDQD